MISWCREGGRTPTRLPSADFEPGVSSLYRLAPSYTALYNDNSMGTQRPFRWGVPSYTALYPALRRKQPPIRFRQTGIRKLHNEAQGLNVAESNVVYQGDPP
jgi:hypothetical protein